MWVLGAIIHTFWSIVKALIKAPLQIMKTLLELKYFFCSNEGTLWAYFYY